MAEQQQFDNASVADSRSEEQIQQDNELAQRLSSIIEDANNRVTPLCKTIRKVGLVSTFESIYVYNLISMAAH